MIQGLGTVHLLFRAPVELYYSMPQHHRSNQLLRPLLGCFKDNPKVTQRTPRRSCAFFPQFLAHAGPGTSTRLPETAKQSWPKLGSGSGFSFGIQGLSFGKRFLWGLGSKVLKHFATKRWGKNLVEIPPNPKP